MKELSIILALSFCGSAFSMDYYNVGKVYQNSGKVTPKVRLFDQGASKEKLSDVNKKKFKLVTKSGAIESGLEIVNDKGEYIFTKEFPHKDGPLLAINTKKRISNIYISLNGKNSPRKKKMNPFY